MRTNRRYVQIDPDVLERVRQIDLLSYLREFEPSNLVKVKGTSNVYCTAEHDSLKISNGKWYWWSRGFGGYSALDYLIKVKEYDFVEAVEILTGDRSGFFVQLDIDDAAVFHSNANHNATILLLCCPAAVRECSAEGLPDISYSIP